MKRKKIIALVLAMTMVAGSSLTVFAADTNTGATGTGTLIPHLDKDVIDVTLPTSAQTANVFDFTVDPEQLIKDAAKLTDGTAVTGNEDGVYFTNAGTAAVDGTAAYTSTTNTGNYTVTVSDLTVNTTYTYDGSDTKWKDAEGNDATVTITITDDDNSGASVTPSDSDTVTVSGATAAGAASYSNKSDAVEFKGQNSVNVDVTVVAAVEASATGAKDIALVADQAALDAATVPSLLMTLKVGTDEKAITTAAGATGKAMIAGAPDNFKVDVNSAGTAYEYVQKADADESKWGSATVQLIGKTNKVDVPTGADALTAPKVKLTWTVTKSTEVSVPTTAASSIAASGTSDILVRLVAGQNASVSRITSAKVNNTEVAKSNIAVSGSGNVWLKGVASTAGTYNVLITYDGTTYSATLNK